MKPTQRSHATLICTLVVLCGISASIRLFGGQTTAQAPDPKNWTAAEDHRNMMEQLGIKSLRPGPSGNESAPKSCQL